LSTALSTSFPGVAIAGNPVPPRMSAFEVTANGNVLIHSKLESLQMPTAAELISKLKAQGFVPAAALGQVGDLWWW
jgi:selT/selW/selH-like putative selenoprotein